MSDKPLAGKTALVTGGARGIGRGICHRLASEGANVAINFRSNLAAAEETQSLLLPTGAKTLLAQADVTEEEQVVEMVRRVEEELGPIDLLVNNAGVFEFVDHQQTTSDIWRRTIDTNLTGAYYVTWAVKTGMLERRFGRIVNIASIGGLRGRPNSIAYSVSKAGLVMLTKSLSEAVADHNIRVNCVAPGLIDTEMPRVASQAVLDQLVETTPLKRIGQPKDIANVVFFLMSDESDFITGQTIVASGGRVLLP